MSEHPLPEAGSVEVSPSILSSDFARLADEVRLVEDIGVKMVHLDVMDGHFVPNITFGPPIVKKLRKYSNLCFDTHLMITDPEKYAIEFIKAGSDSITFHIETVSDAAGFVKYLREEGVNVGVTLNPETEVDDVMAVAPLCDMILVMTVHPGFGGQSFIDEAARKVIRLRDELGDGVRIEVDGGIDPETTQVVVGYGADTLVAGSAIFGKDDRRKAIEDIENAAVKS
jgi:ribulose-phosphate 3-epimerase